MTTEPVEAGLWRHYKGGIYRILGRARWHESPGSPVVFYMDIGTGRQYARLETDFHETVAVKDGVPVRRFVRMDNEPRGQRQSEQQDSGRCRARLMFSGHAWIRARWECEVCAYKFPDTLAKECPYGRTWPPAVPRHPV